MSELINSKMRIYWLIIALMVAVPVLAVNYPAVNIGNDTISVDYVTITIVNQTNASEIWKTDEGDLDNVTEIKTSWLINDVPFLTEATADLLYYSASNTLNFINQTQADLLYYSILNPLNFINMSNLTDYNTTAELDTLYYPLSNPLNFINFSNLTDYNTTAELGDIFVPYSGATNNVDLGEKNLTAKNINVTENFYVEHNISMHTNETFCLNNDCSSFIRRNDTAILIRG